MTESEKLELPWDWIGFQGTGQEPMTQTQFDWLEEHNMSRGDYMAKVARRRPPSDPGRLEREIARALTRKVD